MAFGIYQSNFQPQTKMSTEALVPFSDDPKRVERGGSCQVKMNAWASLVAHW